MTKREIFEKLVRVRTIIETRFRNEDALVVDQLQELIWEIGEDIGEF